MAAAACSFFSQTLTISLSTTNLLNYFTNWLRENGSRSLLISLQVSELLNLALTTFYKKLNLVAYIHTHYLILWGLQFRLTSESGVSPLDSAVYQSSHVQCTASMFMLIWCSVPSSFTRLNKTPKELNSSPWDRHSNPLFHVPCLWHWGADSES